MIHTVAVEPDPRVGVDAHELGAGSAKEEAEAVGHQHKRRQLQVEHRQVALAFRKGRASIKVSKFKVKTE